MSTTSRQLPLTLRYPPDQRLEAFLAAPAGVLAQLRALVSGGDWLYLAGPAGVGKTHLALGFCAEAEAAGQRAHYLPLAAMAGRLAEALPLPRASMCLAIDGLEHIAGNTDDEVALFHFHNAARAAGASVLYAARANPDDVDLVLPDLRSRLSQLARVALQPVDDATRAEILRERAGRRGLVLDDAATEWLLRRVDRDLGSLTRVLDKLDRESLAAQRRLTVPFLRQVLGGELDGIGPDR